MKKFRRVVMLLGLLIIFEVRWELRILMVLCIRFIFFIVLRIGKRGILFLFVILKGFSGVIIDRLIGGELFDVI